MTQSLTSVITAMRYAKKLLLFYIIGGATGTLLSFILAGVYGIMGASILYAAIQFMLLICFAEFIRRVLKEKREVCYDQA